jgi:hypothetical protein
VYKVVLRGGRRLSTRSEPGTAVIWVKCFRETGRCAAKPRGGSSLDFIAPAETKVKALEEALQEGRRKIEAELSKPR